MPISIKNARFLAGLPSRPLEKRSFSPGASPGTLESSAILVFFLPFLLVLMLFCGSVDETDTGINAFIYGPDCTPVANAQLSVFQADDTTQIPVQTATSDENGHYSLRKMAGNCTIWAQKSGLVAAHFSVILLPEVTDSIKDTLRPSVSLPGILALPPNQDPSLYTVKVLGSDRYSVVDKESRFRINGLVYGNFTVRIVSKNPDFSPVMQNVSVQRRPNDTVVDTVTISSNGIAPITGLKAAYDQPAGVVTLSWNAAPSPAIMYLLYRDRFDASQLSATPIDSCVNTTFSDTLFRGRPFAADDTNSYRLKYRVAVLDSSNKIGPFVKTVGVWATSPLKKSPVVVRAGADQTVDIGTVVRLQGSLVSSVWPLAMMEWKIGDGNWAGTGDGTRTFTTNVTFEPDTIQCIFRATDSAGNAGVDTLIVEKRQVVTTYGEFPLAASPVNFSWGPSLYSGRFWLLARNNRKISMWSSPDLNSWNLENDSTGIANLSTLLFCNGKMYLMYFGGFSNRSNDGISWEGFKPELPIGLPRIWSNACVLGNSMYTVYYQENPDNPSSPSNDTLCSSEDGLIWERTAFITKERPIYLASFASKLYILTTSSTMLVSNDKGRTWADFGSWNQRAKPRSVTLLESNDSVMIAHFRDTADSSRMAMLKNDRWIDVPIGAVNLSAGNGRYFCLVGNRLFFLSAPDSVSNIRRVQSIKLY